MEKQKRKKKTSPKLGLHARKMMEFTLPLVLIQTVYTAVLIAGMDTYELTTNTDLVCLLFDRIGMSLAFSVLGSLFFDLLEKREKNRA